jgi:hypothetical protein
MGGSRPTVSTRRLTIGDLLAWVAIAAPVCAALSSAARSGMGTGALLRLAGVALTAVVLAWVLFLLAGVGARSESRWLSSSLLAGYIALTAGFIACLAALYALDPAGAALVSGSLLAMVFYWVTWT